MTSRNGYTALQSQIIKIANSEKKFPDFPKAVDSISLSNIVYDL